MFRNCSKLCFAVWTPVLLAPKKKGSAAQSVKKTGSRYGEMKTLQFKKNHTDPSSMSAKRKTLNPAPEKEKEEGGSPHTYAFLTHDEVYFPWSGRSAELRYTDAQTEFRYIDSLLNAAQDMTTRQLSVLSLHRAQRDVLDAVEEPVITLMKAKQEEAEKGKKKGKKARGKSASKTNSNKNNKNNNNGGAGGGSRSSSSGKGGSGTTLLAHDRQLTSPSSVGNQSNASSVEKHNEQRNSAVKGKGPSAAGVSYFTL
ncbi:hypothetical protein ADEAN_000708700 [Angomonas deanei]|uniref:Uncharacterized protein n=1 Tax=Angomonas deanei TaxID=59799 RepID=A0A7G2CIA9_9TRYP|nr:hypothetical protein ADEAN_000708700 [Angomonas deanei]